MGYPRELQDYEDYELVRELERRTENRNKGLCDYCGHGPGHPACRYPSRHYWREEPNPKVEEEE